MGLSVTPQMTMMIMKGVMIVMMLVYDNDCDYDACKSFVQPGIPRRVLQPTSQMTIHHQLGTDGGQVQSWQL